MPPDNRSDVAHYDWNIEWVDETDSTQQDLLQRCDDGGLTDRTARAARYQRHGRGRLDRVWEAPPGSNLLVSLGFTRPLHEPGIVMRAAALAVVATARWFGRNDVGIKWPNDVLVGNAKLAGLIAQRHESGAVIVGVGVNVNWAPPGAARLGDRSHDVAARIAADANADTNVDTNTDPARLELGDVLSVLLSSFDAYRDEATGGLDENRIDVAYRKSLATLGQRVRVELFESELIGTAVDITGDGHLVVDVDGSRHEVSAGDVFHLRPA